MKDIREPKKEIYKFSNALHRLGLNPRTISRKGSLLFGHKDRISISDSPIRWAEISYFFDRGDEFVDAHWSYWVEYGVPDPRVRSGFPKFRLRSKVVMSSPIIGRVTGFRWVGSEELGIIERLNQDVSIYEVLTWAGTTIRARPKIGCWTIQEGFLSGPNESVWAMYESIANHLLPAVNTSAR
jgi:hypothetical protein